MFWAAGVLLAGCAGSPGDTGRPALAAVELTDVPFFPQSRYQCGPAALATVLVASGAAVTPEALVDQVYVPGRKGSFQVELAAAARRYHRIPYEIPADIDGLHAELAAGRPVLVLQNLAFGWAPRWHYAVVVGFQPDGQRLVLRSGRTERQTERLAEFNRTWSLAGGWALVLLRPGELPSRGDPHRYLEALVAASSSLADSEQEAALAAALGAWPDDADLTFAMANLARASADPDRAATLYRRTLALAPRHPGALNNLADLLSALGCQRAALALVDRGLASAGDNPALVGVLRETRTEIIDRLTVAPAESERCDLASDPRN